MTRGQCRGGQPSSRRPGQGGCRKMTRVVPEDLAARLDWDPSRAELHPLVHPKRHAHPQLPLAEAVAAAPPLPLLPLSSCHSGSTTRRSSDVTPMSSAGWLRGASTSTVFEPSSPRHCQELANSDAASLASASVSSAVSAAMRSRSASRVSSYLRRLCLNCRRSPKGGSRPVQMDLGPLPSQMEPKAVS